MPGKKVKHVASQPRKIALCYVRQSFTRDGSDKDSPERQRANIEVVCQRNGWLPEWHEDVDGHKSGTQEKNRPGWLALKARLDDADVVALVANDLSRLHRKGWRVGDLIDYLDQYGVTLVLAAPGREVDLSTPLGRLFVQFSAILDEWYAADISQRAKDSITHRKSLGKSVGIPPFGTVRGEDGYLKPSTEGAWLLEDGSFVAGKPDAIPKGGALWRGYYEAAEFILTLYATGEYGLEKIAYKFSEEGWAFRDRAGRPRMIARDDVRRVISNWPEYGGIVTERRGKDRPAYETINVDEIPFRSERAVFPLPLLRTVAQVRHKRSRRPADDGIRRRTHPYPLAGITYCAHCERLALQQDNPRLRSRLGGMGAPRGVPRYRHKAGIKCGCASRSVHCEVYEADFTRLVKLLSIRPEALNLMTELAVQSDRGHPRNDADIERQKQEAIALCRRRIDAAVHLYKDGEIDRAEYLQIRETNEREIAHWEARTTEIEKLTLELGMCMQAVDNIASLWDMGDDEDRQELVRSLFESVVYDLDTQRIVDFRLKPWADRYMVLRAALYEDEGGASGRGGHGGGTTHALPGGQGVYTGLPPRSLDSTSFNSMDDVVDYRIAQLYQNHPTASTPVSNATPQKQRRNSEIRSRHRAGATLSDLSRAYDISPQRVYQIVRNAQSRAKR